MRKHALAVFVLAAIAGGGSVSAQDAAQQPCPAGQANTSGGGCVQDMPATEHQQEVLKGGAEATQNGQPAATGEATGTTTGTTMPETPHQEGVLKDNSGG